MNVQPRYFPGNGGDSAEDIDLRIGQLVVRRAKLLGHASNAAFLAGLAHKEHLKSVPRSQRGMR